jgi:alpha-L-fucosidase
MKRIILLSLVSCTFFTVYSQSYQPNWESLDSRPVPTWYKDAKFGIFIHWGVYSVPGWGPKGSYSEWYQYGLNTGDTARIAFHKKKFGNLSYYQLAEQFKAELYNPDEWAKLFEQSGAKYIVLTSKHHDGFANWPSKEASRTWGFPWNAAEAGPHRDLLGDLFTAVRKTSVHAGMYYSLYEWFNPLWLKDKAAYVAQHQWPQMKDLINTYQPDVFWTDGDWEASDDTWKSKEFLSWLYNESPVKDRVVTYDRWGAGIQFHHGGVFTPEYQPDLSFDDHYWEESRGMGFSYGYNRNEDSWDYNSAQALILNLVDKVSRGGNFLLDIGPDEHGKIPPIMEERLLQIGEWLRVNGEAIYKTRKWKTAAQWGPGRRDYTAATGSGDLLLKLTVNPDPGYAVKECFFTYNPEKNDLFAILPSWPSAKQFIWKDLQLKKNTKIELVETKQELIWEQRGQDVSIHLPEFEPSKIKSQFAFVIRVHNTGAFAPTARVQVSYPENSLRPLISIANNDAVEYRYTLDGSIPDEHSTLYSNPFLAERSYTFSVVGFKKESLPGNQTTLPIQVLEWHPSVMHKHLKSGLQLSTYEISAQSVNDLKNAKPIKTTISKNISLNDTPRRENAGLLYDGLINLPDDAIYTFYLSSDDGSKLWIDNATAIDLDGLHGVSEKMTGMALRKGYHFIRLAYFQATGGAALNLQYSQGWGKEKKSIPDALFFHYQ